MQQWLIFIVCVVCVVLLYDQDMDQLQKLRNLLSDKNLGFEEVYRQALAIFEAIVSELENASLEKKEALLEEMKEMSAFLSQEIPRICDTTGMSEAETRSYVQNSQHFTEEQWRLLQSAQKALDDLVRKAYKAMQAKGLEEPPSPPPKPPIYKRHSGPKKSDWKRG